jgi:hypothetical protein
VPSAKTRTLAEIPWLSLLPPEQRAGVEEAYDDPDAAEWDALVAADRALEDDFAGPSSLSRVLKPLGAASALAVLLLAFDAPSVAEQRAGGGGSSASASGTVTAPASVTATTVPEENRAVLAARSPIEVAGTTASGTKKRKPRAPGGGAPAAPSTPPPAVDEPPPLASATLPVVGEVKVPAPRVELPGVELPQLPQLPPVQLPQLPQLPPLLPPSGQ